VPQPDGRIARAGLLSQVTSGWQSARRFGKLVIGTPATRKA